VRLWPVTFGANEKGGMDSEEFEKYVMNSIIPLYPHVRNQHGKHVMLKVDSGPVRMNPNLLAGLVIRYKTQFLENLDLMQGAIAKECVFVTPAQVCGIAFVQRH